MYQKTQFIQIISMLLFHLVLFQSFGMAAKNTAQLSTKFKQNQMKVPVVLKKSNKNTLTLFQELNISQKRVEAYRHVIEEILLQAVEEIKEELQSNRLVRIFTST